MAAVGCLAVLLALIPIGLFRLWQTYGGAYALTAAVLLGIGTVGLLVAGLQIADRHRGRRHPG